VSPAAFYSIFLTEIIITLHVLFLVWSTTVGYADSDESFERTSKSTNFNKKLGGTLIEVDGDALPRTTDNDSLLPRATSK
jgi:hypothetical protein